MAFFTFDHHIKPQWCLNVLNLCVFASLQLVAFILIGVAGYGKAVAIITNISIMGGIIACGVFLLIVAIIGLAGAIKHHQVLLFFVSFKDTMSCILFSPAWSCASSPQATISGGWELLIFVLFNLFIIHMQILMFNMFKHTLHSQ